MVLKDNAGEWVHDEVLEVHDEGLGVHGEGSEVRDEELEVHDEVLEDHGKVLEDSAAELLLDDAEWQDKEGGRGLCLCRVDCVLCGGGHCEAGGRDQGEGSCVCGEGEECGEDLLGGGVSHCPTSLARCRSEPWSDDG